MCIHTCHSSANYNAARKQNITSGEVAGIEDWKPEAAVMETVVPSERSVTMEEVLPELK